MECGYRLIQSKQRELFGIAGKYLPLESDGRSGTKNDVANSLSDDVKVRLTKTLERVTWGIDGMCSTGSARTCWF